MERALDFAEPFFTVRYPLEVEERRMGPRSIVVNLSPQPPRIRERALRFFRSVIVTNASLREVRRCLLVEGFERYGDAPSLFGLHRLRWGGQTFREVHTQIVGYGKMQQCREQDVEILYLEEALAPGATHQPLYDLQGNYPWHQYETITPGVFMPIEMQLGDERGV